MGDKVKFFHKLTAIKCEDVVVADVLQHCEISDDLEKVLADTKSPPGITIMASNDDETVTLIENEKTPHSNKRTANIHRTKPHDEIQPPKTDRKIPLPVLRFADSEAVWLNMVYKEEAMARIRSTSIFSDRSTYLPRMRAILLDWLMEVCEVYHLLRLTYYLTVDYIDRYLTLRPNVPKTQLQLLGVSCLFIAAKLEEIYPPKLSEFSYVCDGACTESEILACELLLLNTLSWDVNPMTPTSWLSMYMQILCNYDTEKKIILDIDSFQFPQYSAFQFVMASQLIDLFSMDPGYLRFSYSVIAAGAIYYSYGKEAAVKVSGLRWDQIKGCVEYMSVFHKILQESTDPRLKSTFPTQDIEDHNSSNLGFLRKRIPNLVSDELHSLQTHVVDLDYFEKASILRVEELGLKVEKVYVKKKKKSEKKDSDKQDDKEETTVVMYEIENQLGQQLDKLEGDEDTDTPVEGGVVNIMKIEKKATLSFDDILSSMHNDCYNLDRYS